MKMLTGVSDDSCHAYIFSDYVVSVFREENDVRLTFQNLTQSDGEEMPYGGSIWMTPEMAKRVGHALTLLSSPDGLESDHERIQIIHREEE